MMDPPPLPGPTAFADLFGTEAEHTAPVCELGTVGWASDATVGDDGTDQNSGATYVKVTLAAGHPQGAPTTPEGWANGHQIMARLVTPYWCKPAKGTACVVLFPRGSTTGHGIGLCLPIAGFETKVLPNAKDGEPVIYGHGGHFVRLHNDGSISLFTTNDGTPDGESVFLRLSPEDGLEVKVPEGVLRFGKLGFHVVTTAGAKLALSPLGAPGVPAGSQFTLEGTVGRLKASALSMGTDAGATHTAAITALQGVVTSLAAAVATLLPSSGCTPAQQAAVAAALSAYLLVAQDVGKNV